MVERITQIIPSPPGYYLRTPQGPDADAIYSPIAAWALMEDDEGVRWVEAVEPTGEGWDGLNSKGEYFHVDGWIEGHDWPPRGDEAAKTLGDHARAMRLLVKKLDEHQTTMTSMARALDAHGDQVRRGLRG